MKRRVISWSTLLASCAVSTWAIAAVPFLISSADSLVISDRANGAREMVIRQDNGCGYQLPAGIKNLTIVSALSSESETCEVPPQNIPSGCPCAWSGQVTTQDWCVKPAADCSWLPWARDELFRRRVYHMLCSGNSFTTCGSWHNAGQVTPSGCSERLGRKVCCALQNPPASEPTCGSRQQPILPCDPPPPTP